MTPLDEKGNYYSGDRVRADAALASAARTVTGVGTAFNTYDADSFEGFLTVSAVAGTSPTLDVRLETSLDAGVSWSTVGAFSQITGTGTRNKVFGPLGDSCRWAWTITGTGPSFTFAVAAEAN